ncbi:MAG: hypothetical protein JWO78_1842 [Micavibrio sp.]|nr:hypothetical protein [Micavibrio sp.]
MKTKILMTVSFLATMAVTVPAMADTSVLCSVRGSYKNGSIGADYKPGVDAKGKPVVSADLAPAPMAAPKSMTIPLTVDMAQRFNSVLPAGSKMDTQVGTIDIMQNGAVMINGKDVSGPADTVCAMEKQKAAALKTIDEKPRKKKAAAKAKHADVPPVAAAPTTEVTAEPATTLAPASPEPAPASTPAPAAAAPVPAAPTPQVLDATPPAMPNAAPQPTPIATAPEPAPAAAPPAPNAAPVPPASGAIVSPTEGNVPRAPLDPLSGTPAPAAPAPAPANGTLSGGAQ